MRENAQPLILFGGTFDPIHRAHIRAALAVSAILGDAPVRLLPNSVPPHRAQPRASAADRLAMVALACAGHRPLAVDDWELRQPGPSYTFTTLKHYRRLIGPKRPLVFMVGADSLAGLDRWEGWRRFIALCHLAVVPRPGAPLPALALARAFPRGRPEQLLRLPAGRRLMLRRPCLDYSATEVRENLAEFGDCRALDPKVLAHIHHHRLYNISATYPDNEAS